LLLFSYPTPTQYRQIAEGILDRLPMLVQQECLPATQVQVHFQISVFIGLKEAGRWFVDGEILT